MDYKDIAERIIELKNSDLELRNMLAQSGQLGEGYNEEMEIVHNRNAKTLNEIIDTIGYPTIGKVGKEANEATWLVIQHAIGHPSFMKKCMKLLEDAVSEKEANSINLAYLTDRIATFEGRPQTYGTQFDWDENGELSPKPYDDMQQVNLRRKSVGLNTLIEQTAIMRRQVEIENQVPLEDFEQRKQAYDAWRKKVGWIQ